MPLAMKPPRLSNSRLIRLKHMADVLNPLGIKINKTYLVLIMICVLSLSFRLWLVDKKWVNPDEGPHLMDSMLALDGLIPVAEFDSRQPLYVYVNAGCIKIFGTNYFSGRLCAVTFSLLTGVVVFLMAKSLFDEKIAVLATVIYWMLPLEVLQSSGVHTEPIVAFLSCLSLYALVRFSKRGEKPWLIGAGIIAALAFYVRQSSIILPLTVLAFLAVLYGGRIQDVAKHFCFFLAGYLAVVLSVMGYYSRHIRLDLLLMSEMSPFGFLAKAGGKLVGSTSGSVEIFDPLETSIRSTEHWDLYYRHVQEAFSLHSFLVLGLIFSLVAFGRNLVKQNEGAISRHDLQAYALLYFWVFFLGTAYGYQYFTEGFYIDYSREFLPPLVLIFSAWLGSSVLAVQRESGLVKLILGGLCLSGIWFVLAPQVKIEGSGYLASIAITLFILVGFAGAFNSLPRQAVFVSIFLGILALVLVSRQAPLKPYFAGTLPSLILIGTIYGLAWTLLEKTARPPWKRCPMVVALSFVVASFVVSINASGLRLSLTYDSIWSPKSVEQMAAYLRAHTGEDDEVISGGVIWELQALRRPFHNISHPLTFEEGISKEQAAAVTLAANRRPPKVIILDGYTEKTYMRAFPRLRELLETRYELGIASGPAMFPVLGYQLKEISATMRPVM